ncbi:MAG: tRNA 5-methoxyuridine(34)/uridine 5-oxyacetic acid(34) synthase CmoB [Desulfuromonadaceae bacterium]|nr:tRNA 5-methoxyuridine(34)/uridine 5-oxyacetic acid(34) synthase CmoB [Desulfuromonadaceae bacterium]
MVLLKELEALGWGAWRQELEALLSEKQRFITQVDGNARRLLPLLDRLPQLDEVEIDLDADMIRIGTREDLDPQQREELREILMEFRHWRKGPFNIFGVEIDSEWRSDLKWNRIKDQIAPLAGRRILDVGSSCGYYLMRMAASKPRLALGLEPYAPFYCQYLLLQRLIDEPSVHCLPVKLEELPAMSGCFDSIFHMGVLSHQRSPIDALKQLAGMLRKGGELVLETLIVEGEGEWAFCPPKRYAKMHNVFFLPTVTCLQGWLERAGFENVRCIDQTWTSSEEQRQTEWIKSESLSDFLDPDNPRKTAEGHPAPLRAVLLAERR